MKNKLMFMLLIVANIVLADDSVGFLVTDASSNEKTSCSEIERKIDDFTGEVKLNSPILASATLYKYIKQRKVIHYLRLEAHGSTVAFGGKGATVLFTDGTKWIKPEKIDVDVNSMGYSYTAFIALNQADLITFSTKKIQKFRLYIFDEEINTNDADKFKDFVKCIKEAR